MHARRRGDDEQGRRQGRGRRLSPLGRRARAAEGQRPKARRGARRRPTAARCSCFVHGTFSDTVGTFCKLWTLHNPTVRQLFASYGDRVYGLDHPTLGVSPIANALSSCAHCRPARASTWSRIRAAGWSPKCWRAPAAAARSTNDVLALFAGDGLRRTNAATCARWSRRRRPRACASSASSASPARRAARCWRRSGSTPICRSSIGASSWRAFRSCRRCSTSCTRSRAGAPTRPRCPASRR